MAKIRTARRSRTRRDLIMGGAPLWRPTIARGEWPGPPTPVRLDGVLRDPATDSV